ncbi:FadR/GntR family transcriptional regulator [Alkalicoccobacillus porphyridii]|uniref:FadR family transcriptional regulator n=1 Tax=Alkalicoccobacillus porphyridii TaxID=2597270 RepID=A0A554A0V6_9BACI|nr:FadR/GntR family transcriptional regulator [Alkalicoccobacillus porphyridii]TSB47276.1 FadR family transcriptional regulator [Alkalicoccobacillus porphyridii]
MFEGQINPVTKTTMSQNIVQQLMELIINGTLARGDKLPSEKQLMEMFGVGRSTLREAIRALVALGLVEVRVPEGTFVAESFGDFFTKHLDLMSKISYENILELVEARVKLEAVLAEMAAEKSSDEDHVKLDRVIERMRDSSDHALFLELDLEFHRLIADMARNTFLTEVLQISSVVTKVWMVKVIEGYSIRQKLIDQHIAVAEAIKAKHPTKAKEAMSTHLDTINQLLIEYKQKNGEISADS